MKLSADNFESEFQILEQEKESRKRCMAQNSIELSKKNMHISIIADALAKKDEYDAFYKIFSKFSHPTSFLINNFPEEIEELKVLTTMLIIHIQLYAWDIHDNIKNGLARRDSSM